MPLHVKSLEGHVIDLIAACRDLPRGTGPRILLSRLQGDGVAQIMSFVPVNKQFCTLRAVSPQVRLDSELVVDGDDNFVDKAVVRMPDKDKLVFLIGLSPHPLSQKVGLALWWAERCGLPLYLRSHANQKDVVKFISKSLLQRVQGLCVIMENPDISGNEEAAVMLRPAGQRERDQMPWVVSGAAEDGGSGDTRSSSDCRQDSIFSMLPQFTCLRSLSLALHIVDNGVSDTSPVRRDLQQALRDAARLPIERIALHNISKLEYLAEIEKSPNLRCCELRHCGLRTLAPLLRFLSLTDVNVEKNFSLHNLDGIAALRHLRTLDASYCTLDNIDELAECCRLTTLVIDHNSRLGDLSVLSGLPSLTSIRAFGCAIRCLDGLRWCPSLSVVQMDCDPSLLSLSGLAGAANLFRLEVNSFKGDNIHPLTRCWRLEILKLTDCSNLATLAELVSAPRLSDVALRSCGVTQLGPLRMCRRLRNLQITSCLQLHTLDGIDGSATLEVLHVTYGNLRSVDGLASCVALREVNVSNNTTLTSLEGLSGAPALLRLYARVCGLQHLRGLSQCPCLDEIDVSANAAILTLEDVAGAPRLRVVGASDCSVQSLEGMQSCALLETLSVNGCLLHGVCLPFANRQGPRGALARVPGMCDLKLLQNCQNLRCVSLKEIGTLRSVSHLAGAPNLETLDVTACDLRSLEGLSRCPRLRELSLSQNYLLTTLSGLEGSTSLQSIDASFCNVNDVRALAHCPTLRTVNLLHNTNLRYAAPALQCVRLETFMFDHRGLQDLSQLRRCRRLRFVKIYMSASDAVNAMKCFPGATFEYAAQSLSHEHDYGYFIKCGRLPDE